MSRFAFQSSKADTIADFQGLTRLFPLPNVVLFPGVLMPLHIFEPRYRQMVADAMSSDRLITMVLLEPGWETDYEGSPAVYPIGCLGRIIHHEPLPDDRSNLVLHGLRRVRLDAEVPTGRLYRSAVSGILKEQDPPGGADSTKRCRAVVNEALHDLLDSLGWAEEFRRNISPDDLALGELCDLASHLVPLDVELKQKLLEELDLGMRAAMVAAALMVEVRFTQLEKRTRRPPIDFSLN